MSSQGQVTIPAKARKALGLVAGDRLVCEVRDGALVMRKLESGIDWNRVIGAVDFGGRTTDEVMRDLRPVRAWEES